MRFLAVVALVVLTGCATELGNSRAAQHGADQIRMIAVQREARVQEAQAQAEMNAALVEALARVAEANPEQASSVSVALAVIGVKSASMQSEDAPTVALQQQKNEALEWTKALAPTVGNLVSGLGVAAINANVQKNASDNNRDVMLGDQQQNARIVESVSNLGAIAVANSGMSVGGNYYDMEGEASVDNSTTSSMDTTTTTNTTTTTEISADTTIDYQGKEMTLADLVTQLQSAGATYSIDLDGDGEADVSGGDSELDADVSCVPTFGGYECTGD